MIADGTAVLFQALIAGSVCVLGTRILTCFILDPYHNKHCYCLPPLPRSPRHRSVLYVCKAALDANGGLRTVQQDTILNHQGRLVVNAVGRSQEQSG